MTEAEKPTKTIVVTNVSQIRQGRSKGGKPWTLWQITAKDEEGKPIEESLKSFSKLRTGKPIRVFVERQDYKGDVSYMLEPAGQGGLGGAVDELRQRCDDQEVALESMRRQLLEAKLISGPEVEGTGNPDDVAI